MSLFPQRCKICGKRNKMDFTVPDEIWAAIIPPQFQNRVVCLACFDSFASMRGIDYADRIDRNFYFAGEKASFTLRIVTREEAPTC